MLTADRDSNEVSLIDATTNKRVGAIEVGKRPFGVTIDRAGKRAYTANVASDDVSVIDIASRKVIATVPVGRRPYAVALAAANNAATITVNSLLIPFSCLVFEHGPAQGRSLPALNAPARQRLTVGAPLPEMHQRRAF